MGRSRGNGEGTVFKSGKSWKVQFSGGKTPEGKRIRITRTVAKYADAVALLQRLRGEPATKATNHKLAAWCHEWLQAHIAPPKKGESMYRSYKDALEQRIVPHLGHVKVSDLTPLQVQRWLEEMSDLEIGARTRQIAYAVLSRAMRFACKMGVRRDNPCSSVDRPSAVPEKPRPFTDLEVKRILTAAKGHHRHAALVLAFVTGLRQGELFGLEWGDVSFSRAEITVRRQARAFGGKVKLADLKTRASNRTIKLPPAALAALRSHQKLQVTRGQAGNERVFPASEGGLTDRNHFGSRFWAPLLEKLGIKHRGFHHTRHTCLTHLLQSGVPINEVAGIAGHTNPATTLRIYAHWLPSDQKRALAATQELVG